MASWMVHLRIADILLERFEALENTEFVIGNIAPDSGVPSSDWSYYTPSTEISHFKNAQKEIRIEKYTGQYFTEEMREHYSRKQYSFYLGYLAHLLTDILWHEKISLPCIQLHKEEAEADKQAFLWKMKADWYDLDFLYLSRHPALRAFQIYRDAAGFRNTYMDIFAEDAFDSRREYIIGFYRGKRENLDREYPFLNEQRMDCFVAETAEAVAGQIKSYVAEMEMNGFEEYPDY